MECNGDTRSVAELALKKINEAESLLAKVDDMEKNHITGASKLRKKIQAEIKVLKKGLRHGSEMKKEHVLSSNLGQLGAILSVAAVVSDVTGILHPFTIMGGEKLITDIVADNGKEWVKVIMRNPRALHLVFISGGRRGTKPLTEVAEDFIICAEQNPVFYNAPKITFWFCCGVSEGLATALESTGLHVQGDRIPDSELGLPDFTTKDSDSEDIEDEEIEDSSSGDSDEDEPDEEHCNCEKEGICGAGEMKMPSGETHTINMPCSNLNMQIEKCIPTQKSSENNGNKNEQVRKVNLDITAMIAYVTSTSNGGANLIFEDKLLTEQAEWERKSPVKVTLDRYFIDSELIACQEAIDHFQSIVSIVGGEEEQARAKELISRITIVPGVDFLKDKIRQGGRISHRARLVFGTGHAHRAITVTSNGNFVRSVEQQGVKLAVLFHQPRALTEAKESTATPI